MNASRRLNFSGRQVTAEVVAGGRDLRLDGTAIVVNAGMSGVLAGERPRKPIPPLCSTRLTGTRVDGSDALIVLRTPASEAARPADIVAEPGWRLLGDVLGGANDVTGGRPFDPDTPLWRSPQDTVGRVAFDPAHLLGEAAAPGRAERFDVRANLWFAPAGTDCFIHNRHDFVEVHTQILGTGRMQKFREQDHGTLYEDVVMSPGWTTPQPFCGIGPDGGFHYPWHQYRADTDSVWLAVEYHRTVPGDSP